VWIRGRENGRGFRKRGVEREVTVTEQGRVRVRWRVGWWRLGFNGIAISHIIIDIVNIAAQEQGV